MAKRILIVEDERKTALLLGGAITAAGYDVIYSRNGTEALDLILQNTCDAVVLDVMLPGCDGLSLVRRLRSLGCPVPVLMLSARGEMTERVEGLDAGADDYLPKPFATTEVVARLRALTRRAADSKTLLEVKDLQMDLALHVVRRGKEKIALAPQEFRLLECLMRHAQEICPRSRLLSEAWGYQFDPGTNIVEVNIRRLREKIDSGAGPKLLHTVKGLGYVLGNPL
ncbi:MAG: response regulator transcription factor [Verrucomicrobiaceae bacterium]|nr:MAG: response regulator transcription factor [Verrucomicrobiaceae bacterium]